MRCPEWPIVAAGDKSCVLREKAIKVPQLIYSERMKLAICLSELAIGEQIRVEEKYRHGFHMQYIDDRAVADFVLFMPTLLCKLLWR